MIVFAKGWPIPAETFKRVGVVYGGANGDFRNAENIARVTNDVVEIIYEAGCTDETLLEVMSNFDNGRYDEINLPLTVELTKDEKLDCYY